MFFDPTMVLLIPGIILAMYAQGKVQATYHKYVQVRLEEDIQELKQPEEYWMIMD